MNNSKTNNKLKTNIKMKKSLSFVMAFVTAFSLFFSASITNVSAAIKPSYKAYVMAPLGKITDWNAFEKQLVTLKNNGVYAVTTDVWWGDVEKNSDNQFDWSYYRNYAAIVRDSGLKWVPIISTHQCGGNVNDTVKIPIPSWIWSKGNVEDMKFKDEKGNLDNEVLSPWWSGTAKQYDELYASFANNFSDFKDIIVKIYLSAGPSGELRYPSYNEAFGWKYPSRGSLEAYSAAAKNDFRNAMKSKYVTINVVNNSWGTNLSDFSQINPPSDGDNFFMNGYKTKYGQDFLTWYESVLVKHIDTIAKEAHNRFDTVFNVPIGAKISGVHWLMNSPSMPHSAEYCAGYYNYNQILDQFKASKLDLTFTCLEMDDSNANTANEYSAPKSLVKNIANLANEKGINVNGENALPIVNNPQKYQNAAEMLFNYNFSGFTLLRLENLVNSDGTPTSEMSYYADTLALKPVPVSFTVKNANTYYGQDVYITGSRWEIGKWDTSLYPAKLNYANGDWTGNIYLGEGKSYEFKGIKKNSSGNVIWESGTNQAFKVLAGGGNYSWSWSN